MKKASPLGGFFLNPGFLILGLIIILGFFLVGGLTPFNFHNTPAKEGEFIAEPVVLDNGDSSLQLKTIKFKQCSGTITVDFLLDRTGSMSQPTPTKQTKISRLKEAVLQLTGKLADTSIIGIQSFDSGSITNDVPIDYYKNNKNAIPAKVNAMQPGLNTPTHDAIAYSYNILNAALPLYKDRKFNFIFVSDGEPNPPTQDPRLFTPNPATQIKNLGINVFSLAIYDSSQAKNTKLSDLLKSIASKPENYYEANNADQVAGLLAKIFEKICQ
jgi:hypothetical protein